MTTNNDNKKSVDDVRSVDSLMPSIKDSIEKNTGVQNKILEKLSGIEKFTNGLNEYIS
jgi:hypothetical protein